MDDLVCYAFGKHNINLHGHSEGVNLACYRVQSRLSGKAALNLDIDDQLLPVDHMLGWSEWAFDNTTVVSFCNERDQLFQLQYATDDCANIVLHHNPKRSNSLRLGIQHAMMIALSSDAIGLHGVTVICRDRAVILSAPSGTGKTTLAKLLQKHCGAAIVNGDFALLSPSEEHGIVFEPTPFCGASKICHNVRLPISAIVFLEQAPTIKWMPLSTREAMTHLLSNVFIPQWDEALRQSVEAVAMDIVGQVPMYKFAFPPTIEAAQMFCEKVNL